MACKLQHPGKTIHFQYASNRYRTTVNVKVNLRTQAVIARGCHKF